MRGRDGEGAARAVRLAQAARRVPRGLRAQAEHGEERPRRADGAAGGRRAVHDPGAAEK